MHKANNGTQGEAGSREQGDVLFASINVGTCHGDGVVDNLKVKYPIRRPGKNIGVFIFDALFDALGLSNVYRLHKSRAGLDYDLTGLARLLTISRALKPASKISTYQEKDGYLSSPVIK